MIGARDPRIAVRFEALAVAYRAKCGGVQARDVIALLATALRRAPDDADLRTAILAFEAGWRADPHAAGTALADAIEAAVPLGPPREFDWQRRADLQ